MDNAEDVLTATRYSLVQSLRDISHYLSKQKILKKMNESKYQDINQRITSLQCLNRKTQKSIYHIQKNYIKVKEVHKFVQVLDALKIAHQHHKQQSQTNRRYMCLSMRQSTQDALELAKDIHFKRQNQKINKLKKQQDQYKQKYYASKRQNINHLLEIKSKVKIKEDIIRNRLKNYQLHKLKLGKDNYLEKVEKQLQKSKQKQIKLIQLKKQAQKEILIFQKTKFLEKQANRIQSSYLGSPKIL